MQPHLTGLRFALDQSRALAMRRWSPVYGAPMFEQLFARTDGLDALRLAIAGASFLLAVAYFALLNKPASSARTTVKTLPVALLALLPLTYLGVTGAYTGALLILAAALALSALGDFFLALKDQDRFFVPGLGSFLAAHAAYLIAFLPRASTPGVAAQLAIVAALCAAGALMVVLVPRLGRLRLPVFAYFAVIMAMVAAALSIREASWILGAGAAMFALSDSLIAVRKFLNPIPANNEAVWITYIAAQFMIVAGLLVLLIPAQGG
jgi:uncharacterized membrane protein YhhN